jgi:hypothetical protein
MVGDPLAARQGVEFLERRHHPALAENLGQIAPRPAVDVMQLQRRQGLIARR